MPEIYWPPDAPPASRWRRFWATVLDLLLIPLLFILGWLIWFFFSAQRSQSPGKQLLGIYVITTDGRAASAIRMWVRDVLLKWLVIANFTPAFVVDALMILLSENAQSLHDKIVETVVVKPVERISGVRPPPPGRAESGDARWPGSAAPPPSAPPGGTDAYRPRDTERRLRELQQLVDDGLITLREYQERRRRILDEM